MQPLGLEGDWDSEEFAFGYMTLREAARNSGLAADASGAFELVENIERRARRAAEDANVAVDPAKVEFVQDLQRTIAFRRACGTTPSQVLGVDPAKVLEEYQKRYPVVTAEYVSWRKQKPEAFTLDLTTEEGKATLKDWHADNLHRFPIPNRPAQGTLGVAYVHFGDATDEFSLDTLKALDTKHAAELAKITVTDEEIRTRYDENLATTDSKANPWSWIADLSVPSASATSSHGSSATPRCGKAG